MHLSCHYLIHEYQFAKWVVSKSIAGSEWKLRVKHTSFHVMNAFTMCFTTEIMLDSVKAMIFIDVVNHPTELVHIFALVSRIVSDNVQMLVSRLSRHGQAIF